MKNKNQKRAQKQTKSENKAEKLNEKLNDQRIVAIDDFELQHVTGGLAFCTTPWD